MTLLKILWQTGRILQVHMAKFVELCNFMRYSFIICDVHHKMEANIDEQVCELCKDNLIGSKF